MARKKSGVAECCSLILLVVAVLLANGKVTASSFEDQKSYYAPNPPVVPVPPPGSLSLYPVAVAKFLYNLPTLLSVHAISWVTTVVLERRLMISYTTCIYIILWGVIVSYYFLFGQIVSYCCSRLIWYLVLYNNDCNFHANLSRCLVFYIYIKLKHCTYLT